MRLEGKTAIVTGGGRGIGREIGRRFAAEGAHVLLADIDGGRARDAADEIGAAGGRATPCTADLGLPEGARHMFEHAEDCFGGRLDILINNAGIAHHGAFLELSFEDWERVLRNNLTSAFLCAQGAARIMAAGMAAGGSSTSARSRASAAATGEPPTASPRRASIR